MTSDLLKLMCTQRTNASYKQCILLPVDQSTKLESILTHGNNCNLFQSQVVTTQAVALWRVPYTVYFSLLEGVIQTKVKRNGAHMQVLYTVCLCVSVIRISFGVLCHNKGVFYNKEGHRNKVLEAGMYAWDIQRPSQIYSQTALG